MREPTDRHKRDETTPDDEGCWPDEVDGLEDDWPIEDLDLESLDDEYDDPWLESDGEDGAEYLMRSDAGSDDDLDEE